MRVSTALLAAAIAAVCNLPASAAVRITSDPGGQIGSYLDQLQSLRSSGENVIIDGSCLSACTMVLGVIPRDRICVTARARLGFHAAWRPDQADRPATDQEGTALLMNTYPQPVREWIARHGGLSPHLIYLSGNELASMYPRCSEASTASTSVWRPGRERPFPSARASSTLHAANGRRIHTSP
jgi:hypothetical protein